MTEKESKELTIEVWTYLAEHPEIRRKYELPKILYEKIKDLELKCPLCELFFEYACTGCPLATTGDCCMDGGVYHCWYNAETPEDRSTAAWGIVNIVKEWKI